MTSSDVGAETAARFGRAGDVLRRLAHGGRTAPAYLLDGPDLAVARDAARWFAAALLCPEREGPCGVCSVCSRVAHGTHPDVHFRGRDRATVISVEALGALLERAQLSPLEGSRQVFVVAPADAMAPEAVGRYLKTLEEPPSSTTFLLVTERVDRLPDTVRSRCQRVRLPGRSRDEIASVLAADGVEASRAARLALLSEGSLARARRLAALSADEVVDALAAAALSPSPSAATEVERLIPELKRRGGEVHGPSEGDPPPGESLDDGAAGTDQEDLRRALEDVFHALVVTARDRAAGESEGPLASLTPDGAAATMSRWGFLGSLVRRNAGPAALLIEAVSALRASAGGGAARG